jgi:hypothetical protein
VAVLLLSFLLHMMLAPVALGPPDALAPVAPRPLTLDLSFLAGEAPAADSTLVAGEDVAAARAPIPAPLEVLPEPADVSLPPPAEKGAPPEVPASPPPETKGEPPREEPPQARPPAPEAPSLNVQVADDTAKDEGKPPDRPKYLGATNTQAADHSGKERIGLDPLLQGESGEVRFAGRRGEEPALARATDPMMGSIAREGTPTPGKLPTPGLAEVRVAQPPVEHRASAPVEHRASAPVEHRASAPVGSPSAGVTPAAPQPPPAVTRAAETPALQSGAVGPALLSGAKIMAVNPESDMVVISAGAEQGVEPQQRLVISRDGKAVAEAEVVRVFPDTASAQLLRKAGAVRVDDEAAPVGPTLLSGAEGRPDIPVGQGEKLDPELVRVMGLLQRHSETATVADGPDRPGAGTREGAPGHEGDGRLRPGELLAVSDVVTATLDSAASEGDVAFSKKATPELAYLKPFFRRMDGKWKAAFFSRNRALSRLEFGQVRVRFALGRGGRLLEAVEVERQGTISDRAVQACLEGIRQAAPHEPFPPQLQDKDRLTETIHFLYR